MISTNKRAFCSIASSPRSTIATNKRTGTMSVPRASAADLETSVGPNGVVRVDAGQVTQRWCVIIITTKYAHTQRTHTTNRRQRLVFFWVAQVGQGPTGTGGGSRSVVGSSGAPSLALGASTRVITTAFFRCTMEQRARAESALNAPRLRRKRRERPCYERLNGTVRARSRVARRGCMRARTHTATTRAPTKIALRTSRSAGWLRTTGAIGGGCRRTPWRGRVRASAECGSRRPQSLRSSCGGFHPSCVPGGRPCQQRRRGGRHYNTRPFPRLSMHKCGAVQWRTRPPARPRTPPVSNGARARVRYRHSSVARSHRPVCRVLPPQKQSGDGHTRSAPHGGRTRCGRLLGGRGGRRRRRRRR